MDRILLALLIMCAPAAFAAPKFDWKKIEGKYDYVECRDNGDSVWPSKREDFYVWIWQPRDKPWEPRLFMTLLRREYSPMALAYDIPWIDSGRTADRNQHTNEIDGYHDNATHESGVRGSHDWDFKYSSGSREWGRGTIDLSLSEDGSTLKYEMSVQRRDLPEEREWCTLKRQPKN